MNKVKRYNIDVDQFGRAKPYLSEHGQWVKRIAYDALSAEVERLKSALGDAAQSLETINKLAGRDEYMQGMVETRSYARNRAGVARAALAGSKEGEL